MKEIPILFSTEMVQALLAGKKTMTRRVLNPQPIAEYFAWSNDYPGQQIKVDTKEEAKVILLRSPKTNRANFLHDVPKIYNGKGAKYHIGDLLWVKETYYAYGGWILNGLTKKGKERYKFVDLTIERGYSYLYEDCKPNKVLGLGSAKYDGIIGWFNRPSLFMPKAAAKIWLKVTGVKCERLQDITAADAIAEGIKQLAGFGYKKYNANELTCKKDLKVEDFTLVSPILSFLTLWESIYGDESLKANPWVFAYSFEVISTNGAPVKTADNEKSNG